jgi:transcriptional regulator with XRE-family HTH domain
MNIDLPEIGKILRERREGQGVSVHKVSDALCLRKSLVEAIEAGNWEPLPHEVYVKGFVKDYARFLGVYNEVAAYFDVPEKKEELPPVAKAATRQKAQSPFRRFARVRVAFFVLLAIVMLFFIYDRVERERVITSKTETATKAAETSHLGGDTGGVIPVSGAKTAGETDGGLPAMSEPKRLMISCSERTWVSVVIDGGEKKEFMLSPEEIIVLNAKERFDLLIGNAGGVKLLLNGKDVGFTGRSGEVRRIDLS